MDDYIHVQQKDKRIHLLVLDTYPIMTGNVSYGQNSYHFAEKYLAISTNFES